MENNTHYKGCPSCDSIQNTESRYCTNCGHEINPPEIKVINKCSECDKEYSPDINYCPDDGTKLEKTEIMLSENGGTIITDNEDDSPKVKAMKSKDLPMNWFGFYTYVRLPIVTIASIYLLFIFGLDSFGGFILLISIILYGTLIYFLDKKSIIGWNLNWYVIIFEILVSSFWPNAFGKTNDIWFVSLIILSSIWFAPNYFYFMKRRHLFK